MAKVDLTLLTQKEEWKVGEAFNYIDNWLLGMGDDYSETVSYLCEMADLDYDEDREYDESELDELAKASYAIIMIENPTVLLPGTSEYYENSKEQLRQCLTWSNSIKGKHPIVEALETIVEYVKPLGDAESLERLENTLYYVAGTNIEVAFLGKEIGFEFFKYLDSDYYNHSNNAFTIGELTYRGHPDYCLGEYALHATLKKQSDEGYAIILNKMGDDVVISFYEYKEYQNESTTYAHKDLDFKIIVSDLNRWNISQLVAKKINEFTIEKMKKAS